MKGKGGVKSKWTGWLGAVKRGAVSSRGASGPVAMLV